jgi:hypothetical protein
MYDMYAGWLPRICTHDMCAGWLHSTLRMTFTQEFSAEVTNSVLSDFRSRNYFTLYSFIKSFAIFHIMSFNFKLPSTGV